MSSFTCPVVHGVGAFGLRPARLGALLGLALLMAAPALADPPASYGLRYLIHDDPEDPQSPVVYAVRLILAPADTDGDAVGWAVSSIEIRHYDNGDQQVYTEEDPAVGTPDGLWWVEHANPSQPQVAEFVLPPHLSGTAAAEDPQDPDLNYDLEGAEYDPPPPPAEPPYEVTGTLVHSFWLSGETPPDEGDKEPVEVLPET